MIGIHVGNLKEFLEQRKKGAWKRLGPLPPDVVLPYKDIKPLPKTRDTSLMDELISKVVVLKVTYIRTNSKCVQTDIYYPSDMLIDS